MSYTSQQVLKYIKKIHKKGFSLDHTVQNHAEWELENIPVANLQIASDNDPYNRILDLDQDHVDSITKQDILSHAIVVDQDGHIIDGNHRAAKAQLLGMTHVPAFVPVVDTDNETYDQFMKRKQTNEVTIDNKEGAGAVPYNQDVDYFGLRVKMKPSTFLRLAAPLGREHSPELEQYIKDGGAIGAPFLDLVIPKEWDDGDFSMPAKVQGHEGRNRMTAIQKIEGDAPIEVHLFPKGGYRARDLTPDYINGFNKGMFAEKSTSIVRGPLFDYNVSESMFTSYELAIMEGGHAIEESADPKAWIEKMYSKYQAWPMDHNQRVMVWGEGEEQQFAVFELKPSMSKRGAVEVAWFQAYPLRQGVGSRAMKELQAQAQADGISLTLYPWDKGRVSQAKLIKFYKQAGFKPATKGAKNMAWSPEGTNINEGGWASTETQNTVITPRTVVEIMEALKTFESSFNTWQAKQELDVEIKIGGPKGSGTYYRRDLEQDPEREYGDVDVECFIHSRAGVSSAQRITEYRMAITDYCLQSPDYSTENGTNIIMKTSSGAVQVDMLYTFHEHANWSRALSPEYRVKGVISTSLTSSLAEVLNLSFSSQGIQVKIRNNQPVSFRQSKDVELRTVSTTPETWAQDIYSLYYYLANGEKPAEFPGGLKAHGGLKDEQRLSDIVLSIKSLANALEESNLLGHGSLISIHDKKDMIRKVAGVYSKKLETAENSSKFDKAQTPAAVEKAKKTKLMLAKYRNEITKLLLN